MIGAGESDTPEFAQEDVGDGREPEPELVGSEHVRTGTISEEEELLFFDAVLHLATGAVEILVELPGRPGSGIEVGDDKAGV